MNRAERRCVEQLLHDVARDRGKDAREDGVPVEDFEDELRKKLEWDLLNDGMPLAKLVPVVFSHCFRVRRGCVFATRPEPDAAEQGLGARPPRSRRDRALNEAVKHVDKHFDGMSELGMLQQMCFRLVGEQRDSKTACRALLWEHRIFINIFDYVEDDYDAKSRRNIFSNRWDLLRRCRQREKEGRGGFYPLKQAKASLELKNILRHLLR